MLSECFSATLISLFSTTIFISPVNIIKSYRRTFLHRYNPSQRTQSCCCSCCCCSSSGCCNSSSMRSGQSSRWTQYYRIKLLCMVSCISWYNHLSDGEDALSLSIRRRSPVKHPGVLEPWEHQLMIFTEPMKYGEYPCGLL